ncbi:MAG: hypothetical protein HC837_18285 [Chloroflexaceae bacterium]|nr:hypothetical protein [Chloroflexaceae bacterium]
MLIAFVLLFVLIMSPFAKKFNRYLIMVFPVVLLLSAIGWQQVFAWLWTRIAPHLPDSRPVGSHPGRSALRPYRLGMRYWPQ